LRAISRKHNASADDDRRGDPRRKTIRQWRAWIEGSIDQEARSLGISKEEKEAG